MVNTNSQMRISPRRNIISRLHHLQCLGKVQEIYPNFFEFWDFGIMVYSWFLGFWDFGIMVYPWFLWSQSPNIPKSKFFWFLGFLDCGNVKISHHSFLSLFSPFKAIIIYIIHKIYPIFEIIRYSWIEPKQSLCGCMFYRGVMQNLRILFQLK